MAQPSPKPDLFQDWKPWAKQLNAYLDKKPVSLEQKYLSAFAQETIPTDSGTTRKRARWFSTIDSAPTAYGDWDSIDTAFTGDLERVPFPIEWRVTGSTTNPLVSGSYSQRPELSAIPQYFYNTTGDHDLSTGDRTGISQQYIKIGQYGGGDAGGITLSGIAVGTKAGSTTFLQNPAVFLLNGDTFAGTDGVYLNVTEFNAHDLGKDAAAIGMVFNSWRTNTTGAKFAHWAGFRSQSKNDYIDAHFSGVGKSRTGIDFSSTTFDTNKTAIALKADDRIQFNTTVDSSGLARPPSAGFADYITYTDSIDALNFVVANTSSFQVYSSKVEIIGNANVGGSLRVSADNGGLASKTTITSASDLTSNSTGVGTILFKGTTSRDSSGFVKIYIGTTAYYVPVFSAITG